MNIPFSCARFVTGVCSQESLKHIERPITVRGVVAEASETNSLLIMAVFRYRICGQDTPQTQEGGKYTEPPMYPVCGKKTAMRVIQEQSRFVVFLHKSLFTMWAFLVHTSLVSVPS